MLCALARGWTLLEGRAPQRRPVQTGLWEVPREEAGPQAGRELVDLKHLSVERVREFGSVYLALALWRRLGLPLALIGTVDGSAGAA